MTGSNEFFNQLIEIKTSDDTWLLILITFGVQVFAEARANISKLFKSVNFLWLKFAFSIPVYLTNPATTH